MNRDDLYRSIGEIDDDILERSERASRSRTKTIWLKWAAVAACLCLVFACGLFYHAQNPDDFQTLVTQGSQTLMLQSATNSLLHQACIPIADQTAVYWQVDANPDQLKRFMGAQFHETESAIWYRPEGSDNLKYLIRQGSSGKLTLWVFSSFEMGDGETYTYGDVLRIVFGVDNAEDIVSITTSPFTNNNTDLGKAIQKKIGTHTYDDPEDISAFYDVIQDVVCFGEGSYNPSDDTRFTYSFSTDEIDKHDSGESTYGTRCLSITFADGTTLDSWKYAALSGSFFEYGALFTEPLEEDDVQILNEIFGIR